jgi:FKBP-type peptidyl-prolyl cis-trans isomerase SlyD
MEIKKNCYVSLNYTIMDNDGKVLDSSEPDGPIDYIHGSGMLIPGLEKALEGKKQGEALKVKVEPKDAYGERKEDLIYVLPKEQLGEESEIKVGMQFEADTPGGTVNLVVTEVKPETVTLDANHPFAGKTLNFAVSVVECRGATEDELKCVTHNKPESGGCGGSCGGHGGHGGGHGGCGC